MYDKFQLICNENSNEKENKNSNANCKENKIQRKQLKKENQ